ncbi:MAG: outer membrane protein assembly factor BamD [Candidatus Acidiferrales bacterium]|jgi:outer membrane protein assembly factor BamD
MVEFLIGKRRLFTAVLFVSLAGVFPAGAHAQKPKVTKVKPKNAAKQNATDDSAEPDKVLYDRAVNDVKHHRYVEARLSFQTLINTYPDSEYLAKAKLGTADSYYNEGGTSNLTQAVEEYKNFIVFFPFLDEAAYAQMQVGMAHYRMMDKSDRDNSQAESAENEFQTFLLKYPQSPLLPQAEQDLRNVQEVLADGEFRIARFYYVKRDYRASAARLIEVTQRYPLYSGSDEALSMLGSVYMRAKQVSKNEDDQNHWADLAAQCYSRVVRDYPLSSFAPDAKARLKALGMPIPAADPEAIARMQKQQMYEKHHRQNFALKLPLGMVESRPDVSAAARSGEPNMNPPDDAVSATEVLKPGAAGPSFTVAAQNAATGDSGGGTVSESGPVVEGGTSESSGGAPATTAAAEIIEAPNSTAASTPTPGAAPAPASAPASDTRPAAASAQASPNDASTSSSSKSAAQPKPSKPDPKNESTSKKKKGLKKIIPF